eukprot:m.65756 g.65756  ORF g.65756 m.65756 type:complete len:722 (+) comp12621_c0_seq2:1235-3400(+)
MASAGAWIEFVLANDPSVGEKGDSSGKERGQDTFFLQTVSALTDDVTAIAAALEATEEAFMTPLAGIVPAPTHAALFANFAKVRANIASLRDALQQAPNVAVNGIGELLSAHAQTLLGVFTVYLSNQSSATSTLEALLAANGEAGKRIKQAEFVRQLSSSCSGPVELQKLLRLPQHFISMLPDRVDAVVRATPSSRGFYTVQQDAALAVRHACEATLLEVQKLEALSRLVHYDRRIAAPPKMVLPKLLQPGRAFVRERPLTFLSTRGKKATRMDKETVALIFSDLLLITTKTSADTDAKFMLLIPPIVLGDGVTKAENVPDTEIDFVIILKTEILHMRTTDRADREKWLRLINSPRSLNEGTLMATRRERTATVAAAPPAAACTKAIGPREISIDRSPDGKLGLELDPTEPGFLAYVETPGPAATAGLRDFDVIQTVNGVSVVNSSLAELKMLLDKPGRVDLTVSPMLRRCNLRRSADGTLGMHLRGGHPAYVSSVLTGGPADEEGVKIGDHVWEINGQSVRTCSLQAVTKMIQDSRGSIVTLLMRSTLRQVLIESQEETADVGIGLAQTNAGLPCFIRTLTSGGLAARAGCNLGDQLWDVGAKRVRSERLDALRRLLVAGPEKPLRLSVLSTLRRVSLTADRPGNFGFTLEDSSPRIAAVAEEGPASKAAMRKGDMIWAINSQNVLEEPIENARGLLAGQTSVELLVPLSSLVNHTSQLL